MNAPMQSHSPPVSQWLTTGDEVISHLFFAAAEIGAVEIDLGPRTVPGALAFPEPSEGTISFYVSDAIERVDCPAEGGVVRVRYTRGNAAYSFLTEIRELRNDRCWELVFPRTVERTERRATRRYNVLGLPGFEVNLGTGDQQSRSLQMFDLSIAGLSIVFEPDRNDISPGQPIRGTLGLGPKIQIPFLAEVCHVRDLQGGSGERLAGCRIIGMNSKNRMSIGRTLSALARQEP